MSDSYNVALFYILNQKVIPLSASGLSAKVYSTWKKLGIVGDKSGSSKTWKWVKLNYFEYNWIKLCLELRNYGVSLETLKDIRTKILLIDTGKRGLTLESIDLSQLLTEYYTTNNIPVSETELKRLIQMYSSKLNPVIRDYGMMLSQVILSQLQGIANAFIFQYRNGKLIHFEIKKIESASELPLTHTILVIPFECVIDHFFSSKHCLKLLQKFKIITRHEIDFLEHLLTKKFISLLFRNADLNLLLKPAEMSDATKLFLIKKISLKQYQSCELFLMNKKTIKITATELTNLIDESMYLTTS